MNAIEETRLPWAILALPNIILQERERKKEGGREREGERERERERERVIMIITITSPTSSPAAPLSPQH